MNHCNMRLYNSIVAASDKLSDLRQHLHANPELGFDVHQTADLIADYLENLQITVNRGIGKTGLVGTLKRGTGSRSIGLRADMDALPIQEKNTFSHRSRTPGIMHACGHDGHIAMLLGAAKYLAEEGSFDGTVNFIFQPAEEGLAGGREMVKDGLFERFPCDMIFGLHNWPGLPVGQIGSRTGSLMAASAVFEIVITGIGSHAAMPHLSADAVLAASELVMSLQGIVSRNVDPIDPAVLSVCMINGGVANNVIAHECRVSGAVRSLDPSVLQIIGSRIQEIAQGVASSHRCSADVRYDLSYPATINSAEPTNMAMRVAEEIVGIENVHRSVKPTMAGEDFSYMLLERPGCYAFIGNGDGSHRTEHGATGPCELHNDCYDFNDALIPIGATYFSRLVETSLAEVSHAA